MINPVKYVAFLRAINVGGHVVKMDVLRSRFEGLGFINVETFIASGNVVFESRSKNRSAMERRIEQALEKALTYEVATFLRTPAEVAAIARYQPFARAKMASALSLNVGLLKKPLDQNGLQALSRLKTDSDDFRAHGSELYWMGQKKQSESKISNAVFEKALKVKATFRGMRTMEKLAAKYPV